MPCAAITNTLADGAFLGAVRPLEAQRGDAAVGADLDGVHDGAVEQLARRPAPPARRATWRRTWPGSGRSGCSCSLPQQGGRSSYATELRACGVGATDDADAGQRPRPLADPEYVKRDRRQRIRLAARRAEIGRRIAGDAQLALGLAVPRLQIVVGDRPVDADAECATAAGNRRARTAAPCPASATSCRRPGAGSCCRMCPGRPGRSSTSGRSSRGCGAYGVSG